MAKYQSKKKMAKQKEKLIASNKRPIEQYEHKDKTRVNNPPVGLVKPETDKDFPKKSYAYDPHLDPQLQWAGKAERMSFEVPTVSLHVHERIDPRTIIETVRKKNGSNYEQMSLFSSKKENPPMRDAIEFYKHPHNWSNRLIAGDSLLVMNSLLEKEGLGGQVQMIYIDPPYGIKYGSNFQPFVNKRDVKDGKDEDLTAEPEMIKAFRDTWDLGIHSYLAYLRDRLLLSRELLQDSGSIFVQISDENVHHVKELLDEVFGTDNFVSLIAFVTTSGFESKTLARTGDYLLWFAKDKSKVKYRQLYTERDTDVESGNYRWLMLPDGSYRGLTASELRGEEVPAKEGRLYQPTSLISQGSSKTPQEFRHEGRTYFPGTGQHWKTTIEGLNRLAEQGRIHIAENSIRYVRFAEDFPFKPINNIWGDTATGNFTEQKIFVVQTSTKTIQKCILMTTDPGDLILDPTCGSGTSAYVSEQWGRRWITCDTSRVAVTLTKERLMTEFFDFFELAQPNEGVGSGFKYRTVPHVTLKSIANAEPAEIETLYDQPFVDPARARVTGPFTVEAVPAPVVKPVGDLPQEPASDPSIARSGETLRQSDWREELLRTGIRGKKGQYILFSRLEPMPGTRYLHAEGETKPNTLGADRVKEPGAAYKAERIVVSFGPDHAPLEQRQVELALQEADTVRPKPTIMVFAAFQFDPEAAKDIDETNWPGVTLLKAQMNPDLLTEDLRKGRVSNESFWLIGQPDVRVESGLWLVDSHERRIARYGDIEKLSGVNSLAKINGLSREDLSFYAVLSERRDLWLDLANKASGGIHTKQHRGGPSKEQPEGVSSVSGDREGVAGGGGDLADVVRAFETHRKGSFREFIERLHRNKQIAERAHEITIHSPLTTRNFFQVTVEGFDYYNTRTGQIESGGSDKIAIWMLDTDYDGRSLFPRQVFFPMSGEGEGWSRLAKTLRAEIDEELIEAYRGNVSLPFEPGKYNQIAIKIVDDRGIESLKVMGVK